jgi:hypothetical protein
MDTNIMFIQNTASLREFFTPVFNGVVFSGKLDGNYAERLPPIFLTQHASTNIGLLQML